MKIIECPRDAMQGIKPFIPTEKKAEYLNQLLKVGFDTLDFGSFVSPKAVPQLKDTGEVLSKLNLEGSRSKLLAIVANTYGAEKAAEFEEIDYFGFPFSISETFQQRNINSTVEKSYERAKRIAEIAEKHDKKVVIYISMAFGNPYGDPWNADLVLEWVERFNNELDVETISLSDTVGNADKKTISRLFNGVKPLAGKVEIGAHLHTTAENQLEKLKAAYDAGCRRFDGAVNGLGGCPMAADELTGNMPTEALIEFAENENAALNINKEEFEKARRMAGDVFPL